MTDELEGLADSRRLGGGRMAVTPYIPTDLQGLELWQGYWVKRREIHWGKFTWAPCCSLHQVQCPLSRVLSSLFWHLYLKTYVKSASLPKMVFIFLKNAFNFSEYHTPRGSRTHIKGKMCKVSTLVRIISLLYARLETWNLAWVVVGKRADFQLDLNCPCWEASRASWPAFAKLLSMWEHISIT